MQRLACASHGWASCLALRANASAVCRAFATRTKCMLPELTDDEPDPSTSGVELPRSVDTNFRTPTELVLPPTKRQDKFASRVHRAMLTALTHDTPLREALVNKHGFTIEEVRVSRDGLKAYVLWDSYMGQADVLENELAVRSRKFRAAVAKALKTKNAPELLFRRNEATEEEELLESLLQDAAEEEESIHRKA